MRRRTFLALAGATTMAVPSRLHAQRTRRIGILMSRVAEEPGSQARILAFTQTLQQLGWTPGRDLEIDYQWGPDVESLMAGARHLVALAPDAILVQSNPGVEGLRRIDRQIPAVMVQVGDPLSSGFVDSLSRPNGNLTGFLTFEEAFGGKWVEILKEAVPAVERALVLLDSNIAANVGFLRAAEAAASVMRIKLYPLHFKHISEVSNAVAAFAKEPNGGVIALPNPDNGRHRALIGELAARHRLAMIFPFRTWLSAGGLISYGVDEIDQFRRAAGYIDRILRGAKPSELPIQAPTKFELAINLKTAKAIGLEIPPTLLARADEVIE